MTVLDLQRNAVACLREHPAVHTLGPDLHDHAARVRAHHLSAGTVLAGDQLRMAQHRLENNGVGSGEWYATVRTVPQVRTVTNHSPLPTPKPCIGDPHVAQWERLANHAPPLGCR